MGSLCCVQIMTLLPALGLMSALSQIQSTMGDRGRDMLNSFVGTQEGPEENNVQET